MTSFVRSDSCVSDKVLNELAEDAVITEIALNKLSILKSNRSTPIQEEEYQKYAIVTKDLEINFQEKIKSAAKTLKSDNEGILRELLKLHLGMESKRLIEFLKAAQTLSICFVFDATGSMGM